MAPLTLLSLPAKKNALLGGYQRNQSNKISVIATGVNLYQSG
jgi:hypothetical protein